ncbi:hypothetical protein CHU98_g11039, partial [Xylaria longipes]
RAPAASVKDLREPLRCSDVKKPLAEIERDLEAQAKFGDLGSGRPGKGTAAKAHVKQVIDLLYPLEISPFDLSSSDEFEVSESDPLSPIEISPFDLSSSDEFEVSESDGGGGGQLVKGEGKAIVVIDDDDEEKYEMAADSEGEGEVTFVSHRSIKKEEEKACGQYYGLN